MQLDPLSALDRTSATFKTDLDTFFLTKLPAFSVQAESLRSEVNGKEASAVSAASTATTKAGEAAASAGAAAVSASTAATQAGIATTKAGEAAASAGAAAGSASTAATQAGIATTKAGEAGASADAAALSAASIAGGPVASINGLGGIVTGIATTADITLERSAVAILTNKTVTGLKEKKAAVAASNIDIATGNCFSKTTAGVATWTVSNVPAAGVFASFILDLTNGGSAAQTWWAGVKWAGGTLPLLTAAGRDSLGFYTHDGGVTWTGLVLARDVK